MSFLDEISKLTTAAPSIDPELVGFADQSAFISSKSTVSLFDDMIYVMIVFTNITYFPGLHLVSINRLILSVSRYSKSSNS